MYRTAVLMILLVATVIVPLVSDAQPRGRDSMDQNSYQGMPYGRYCPGPRWGPYGARNTVKTAEEAKQAIETYFADSGQTVKITRIEGKRWYFEADIANPDGKLIDKVIIDRRTGRIRSIY